MKKIIYTRPDGGVSVISIAPQERVALCCPEVLNMTYDKFVEWVRDKDVPKNASDIRIVEESDVPVMDDKRHAWVIKAGKIEVDAVKVQQKLDADAQKEAKKDAVLAKLKISKEDLGTIRGII